MTRVLVVDHYYPDFLRDVYARRPRLFREPYDVQWRALMDECFGTSDFYSRNLAALGHASTEVVVNAAPMQIAWGLEHLRPAAFALAPLRRRGALPPQLARLGESLLIAQARAFRAEVAHFQAPQVLMPSTAARLRRLGVILTGQIASPVPDLAPLRSFDLLFSSIPGFVERFRQHGIRAEPLHLGFEPAVLERLPSRSESVDLAFIGGISPSHAARIEFLEAVAAALPLSWWGYGAEHLHAHSPLRSAYRGPAWGLDMYAHLASAKICLNRHIDIAGPYANNMRLYEVTGVGSLLLTDAKTNLGELFEAGEEVVTWNDTNHCVEQVSRYLADDSARRRIAAAGQRRTLRDHTYRRRMEQYHGVVSELMRERRR